MKEIVCVCVGNLFLYKLLYNTDEFEDNKCINKIFEKKREKKATIK